MEEIIIYDETEKQFIYSYGKNIFIHLTDIKAVKYKNRFLEVLDPIFLFSTKNDGKKIKEVVHVYDHIKEIIKQINI